MAQIQKNYQKPQDALKAMTEAASNLLSKHNQELQAAEALVREAEAKTRDSDRLLLIVRASLREFSVSLNCSLPG